jgi:hypothetical protein
MSDPTDTNEPEKKHEGWLRMVKLTVEYSRADIEGRELPTSAVRFEADVMLNEENAKQTEELVNYYATRLSTRLANYLFLEEVQ